MAYQMAPTQVTLNDLEGHSPVAGLFVCTSSAICAAFCKISNDAVRCTVGLSAIVGLLVAVITPTSTEVDHCDH